tara:strand:- start:191 stop:328 length:138 start_codon:yes stop_codon:yes gene_type:complete
MVDAFKFRGGVAIPIQWFLSVKWYLDSAGIAIEQMFAPILTNVFN